MSYKIPASSVIQTQFPQFVQEDYPNFIKFVELYYKFLNEQQVAGIGQSFDSIRDVDDTLDSFIDNLWKEFGINVPRTTPKNDRNFLKHIKEFYSTKGSEESIRILFRHLFGKEIDIKYPQNNILRVSDGKWNQDVSVIVKVNSGDINSIVGQYASIQTKIQNFNVVVDSISPLNECYEVFVNQFIYKYLEIGDYISFNDVSLTIVGTITSVSVFRGGSGFNVGQLYDISTALGSNAKIKITNVDSIGSIKTVQVINFGSGYDFPFYYAIASNYTPIVFDPTLIQSFTDGTVDYGYVTNPTYYTTEFATPDYCADILSEFYNDSTKIGGDSIDDLSVAILLTNIGAVRKYPGYFATSNGFLSDVFYIQNDYYQIYSYVISTNEALSNYKNIIKTLVHPAGMALFGDYVMTSELNLMSSLESVIRTLSIIHEDIVNLTMTEVYAMVKPFDESLTSSMTEVYAMVKPFDESLTLSQTSEVYAMVKPLEDNSLAIDLFGFISSKGFEELTSLSETAELMSFGKNVTDFVTSGITLYWDEIYCDQGYNNNGGDFNTIIFDKVLTESLLCFDDLGSKHTKPLIDNVSSSDNETWAYTKPLIDNVSSSDNETLVYAKSLIDNAVSSDNETLVYTKPLIDNISSSDNETSAFTKPLIDSVDSYDNETLAFTKSVIDNAVSSDNETLAYAKKLMDSISFTQSYYWDATYSESSYIDTTYFPPTIIYNDNIYSIELTN